MLVQLRQRPLYFILLLILLISGFFLCACLSKPGCFQLLNHIHTYFLDLLFINLTLAGNGWVSVALVIVFLLVKKRKEALTLLIAFISSGLFVQLLKHLYNSPRPHLYFNQLMLSYNHFVKGVTLDNNNSFPSGHTASAFAMATVLALIFPHKSASLLAVILAPLIGYSRIYLAEHFLSDVLAGALTGIVFAMLSYYIIWQTDSRRVMESLAKMKRSFAWRKFKES